MTGCSRRENLFNEKDSSGIRLNPLEMESHFYVLIPGKKIQENKIVIYERFHWDVGQDQLIGPKDRLRPEFPGSLWKQLAADVAQEFNVRLKQNKQPPGRFKSGGVPLERCMGKELMLLLWSLEGADADSICVALRNWLGLAPEECWWLYTMTNAATGGINDAGRGWRMALRYILCENPVYETPLRQLTLDFNEEQPVSQRLH